MTKFRIKENVYSDGVKIYSLEYLTPKDLGDARLAHLADRWFSCYDDAPPPLSEGNILVSGDINYIKSLIPLFKKKYRDEVLMNPDSTHESIEGLPKISATNFIYIE